MKLELEIKLKKNLPSHVLLSKMRVIDEDSRKSFAYNDPTYIPFYYWLGTILKPQNIVEIGFRLGLLSGVFLKACKTVNRFIAIQEFKLQEHYSPRLGKSNIKDVYKGEFYVHVGYLDDDVFKARFNLQEYELAIINEESSYDRHRCYLDFLWPQMSKDGIIVMDYLNRNKSALSAYRDFCSSKNLESVYVNTTYGVGLIKKS